MARIITAISLIMLAAAGPAWADCQYIFPWPEQSGDDWVTAKWCASGQQREDLLNGLRIFVDESGQIKTLWTSLFLEQGADFCNPLGLLTRLLNAEQMLYEVVYHRDNITIPKNPAQLDYASFVVEHSDDGYEPVCTAEYEAQNPYPFGTTKLSQPYFTRAVPYRAATLVHEATHDDVDHVGQGSLCIFYAMRKDNTCSGTGWDFYCDFLFNDCMAMTDPYWPRGPNADGELVSLCGESVDIGFGLWNAQTNGVSFMLNSMDTFLKNPETNELLIVKYNDKQCGYVPLISEYAYIELKGIVNWKAKDCFLITPVYPGRSQFWIEFYKNYFLTDYSSISHNYIVAPPWKPTFPCDRPCVPEDYLKAGTFACNEDYQPENEGINQSNHDLCKSLNDALPAQFTPTDVAKAADLFKKGKKPCISGVSSEYLQAYCDQKIADPTIVTLSDLELRFTIDDQPNLFVPDGVFAECAKNFCRQRFDPVWIPQAQALGICYEWNDPLGCTDFLCGKLGDTSPGSFEHFETLLCRKSYFDNSGDPKDYMTKDAGKCDQDYMDCVAQEAFETWLTTDACTLNDQPGSPYPYIAHFPQFHALDLAASSISYEAYKETCPTCQLQGCEAKQAICTSFMKNLASAFADFLAVTAIPNKIVVKQPGKPTGPTIDPVISPIERSLKALVQIASNPIPFSTREIIDQLLTVPEYQHASARALGHEAFFSLVGTKGFQNIFAKETLALYENATLRFNFDLNPRQSELLPSLLEMSDTRRRIEAPETLSLLESLATSNPKGIFEFMQELHRTQSVREINAALDTLAITIPAPPTLLSPANGATYVSTSPTLTWNASSGATSYRLQIATDAAFGTIVYDQNGIAGPSQGVTGLHGGRLHYWRCTAANSAGTSPWSDVWSFTTGR